MQLDYAPVAKGRALRRWVNRLLIALALGAAALMAWYGWQWRLKQDEKAFNAHAAMYPSTGLAYFDAPPTAAALRHLQRVPNVLTLAFSWRGNPDPATYLLLRGRRFPTITTFYLAVGMDTDGWLKELSRPDTGFKALTTLYLAGAQVTDAAMKDIARQDSGLKALTSLYIFGPQVTDAGLKELARPDTGLKALTTLDLDGSQVSDAGLKDIARPDSGLKALTTLDVSNAKITPAGIAALRAARPGLKIVH